ncbi:hypothetical protein GEMRC1_003800 [Eukaryota sp. GEM-RC1]
MFKPLPTALKPTGNIKTLNDLLLHAPTFLSSTLYPSSSPHELQQLILSHLPTVVPSFSSASKLHNSLNKPFPIFSPSSSPSLVFGCITECIFPPFSPPPVSFLHSPSFLSSCS